MPQVVTSSYSPFSRQVRVSAYNFILKPRQLVLQHNHL